MKLKCQCGHEGEVAKDVGRFRCSACGVTITRAAPGEAVGANDLRVWSMRRLMGLSGDAPEPRRKKHKRRRRWAARPRLHRSGHGLNCGLCCCIPLTDRATFARKT
jgi:hypothetical protein